MHIGIDARLTHYRVGGISTYIRRLVQALETLDNENAYTVFHSRKANGTLVKHFRRESLWTPCHYRLERLALSIELARFHLDLLHSPDFIPPWRGAHRHVITIHDLNFLHYPQFLTAESRRYYNAQIERAVHQADHILAISEATKRDLVTLLDVAAERITVHRLAADESFRPLPQETLTLFHKQLALPNKFILFVGTIEPRKNIPGLLESYQQLLKCLPDAPPLVLAGQRGWLFEQIAERINRTKLNSRILWREDISHEALPALYNLASILVLPSFYEGFGLPALEAMACGTVPIVSNRSALPEVVGEAGLQFDPDDPTMLADSMYRALTDDAWRARMKPICIQRAASFTWEQTASVVLSVYRAMS